MTGTLGCVARTASLTCSNSLSEKPPPKKTAWGALRFSGGTLALVPRPEAGAESSLPAKMAGSSTRAMSGSAQMWTTVGGFVS